MHSVGFPFRAGVSSSSNFAKPMGDRFTETNFFFWAIYSL
jgi:hypothetical protein